MLEEEPYKIQSLYNGYRAGMQSVLLCLLPAQASALLPLSIHTEALKCLKTFRSRQLFSAMFWIFHSFFSCLFLISSLLL